MPYEVSSLGRIRNPETGIIRKLETTWQGYQRLALPQGAIKVHQVVCEAFHGPAPSPDHVPNHLNGIKSDNRAENLEWTTRAGNAAHASRTRLLKTRATGIGPGKLDMGKARAIREKAKTMSNMAIAKEMGLSNTMVGLVVNNRCWRERISPDAPQLPL